MAFNDTKDFQHAAIKAIKAGAICYSRLVINGHPFSYTFFKSGDYLTIEQAREINPDLVSLDGDAFYEIATFCKLMESFTIYPRVHSASFVGRACKDNPKDYTSHLINFDPDYIDSLLTPQEIPPYPVDTFNCCK